MESGRELDAVIAEKVMGWRYVTFPTGVLPHVKHWHGPNDECLLPHYSTSIADAWKVVEKLKTSIGSIEVWYVDPTGWGCRIYSDVDDTEFTMSYYDTAPHAICLAALKAVTPTPEEAHE